jgi:hypothetical protein
VFFIVNKTKSNISIGDIGVTLGPRQAVDLDKIMNRSKSESSKSLISAKTRGDIEIRIKDEPKERKQTESHQRNSFDLSDMKDAIIGEVKDTLKELLKEQNNSISKDDFNEIAKMLLSSVKNTETVIYRQDLPNIRQDEEVDMDEEILAKINARTVDEIVKDTKIKSINYNQEKQEENTILSNVDELMDLL